MSVIRGAAWALAMYGWATHAKAATYLEQNLANVTGLTGRPLRALARRGMASTARYYAETLELARMKPAAVDARVRLEGYEGVKDAIAAHTGTVAVLGHNGNWDLIGAYACRNIIKITAVAEVLKPREVFNEFVALREQWGMRILGHEGGATFRELIRLTRSERTLVCLLSDRDLSGKGIQVQMWGHGVRVAPGPAALAHAAHAALIPVGVYYERLHGSRRRAAKSRWGTVLAFGMPLYPDDFVGEDKVSAMSQAWANQLAAAVSRHPEDWHMLQRFGWIEA
ncbi:KDO2-lipid IV(A) lauroyltransferase [Demequina lutea]|uniref:KDO2-lipid IV(A) lauroyltransferase n=1 Tax=Demequina lutea TaxID=431489 RepID=A0A7Z0CK38_9MICO|nr:KDO2-lipid IV(A) lauroyltransferase [Demequina lutea]